MTTELVARVFLIVAGCLGAAGIVVAWTDGAQVNRRPRDMEPGDRPRDPLVDEVNRGG